MKCSICGNPIEVQSNGWGAGHNAWPVGEDGERCCGTCNMTKVVPERMRMVKERPAPTYIGDINELNNSSEDN